MFRIASSLYDVTCIAFATHPDCSELESSVEHGVDLHVWIISRVGDHGVVVREIHVAVSDQGVGDELVGFVVCEVEVQRGPVRENKLTSIIVAPEKNGCALQH